VGLTPRLRSGCGGIGYWFVGLWGYGVVGVKVGELNKGEIYNTLAWRCGGAARREAGAAVGRRERVR